MFELTRTRPTAQCGRDVGAASALDRNGRLEITRLDTSIRCLNSGDVLPWMGPALRGIVARHLKQATCRHPPEERRAHWTRCSGCPYLQSCPYGRLYEPDLPAGTVPHRGRTQPPRPLVLEPYWPLAEHMQAGLDIPLRITVIGAASATALPDLHDALIAAGDRPGLGPDHIRFRPAPAPSDPDTSILRVTDLPDHPDDVAGTLPRLGVTLTSPLFMTERDAHGRRKTSACPRFGQLFRAAARTLTACFADHRVELVADFRALTAAADGVALHSGFYEPFRQRRWSSRTGQRYDIGGVVGGAWYRDVPTTLLPWLLWGGRLHVGTHRVAGAGGWRLVVE